MACVQGKAGGNLQRKAHTCWHLSARLTSSTGYLNLAQQSQSAAIVQFSSLNLCGSSQGPCDSNEWLGEAMKLGWYLSFEKLSYGQTLCKAFRQGCFHVRWFARNYGFPRPGVLLITQSLDTRTPQHGGQPGVQREQTPYDSPERPLPHSLLSSMTGLLLRNLNYVTIMGIYSK